MSGRAHNLVHHRLRIHFYQSKELILTSQLLSFLFQKKEGITGPPSDSVSLCTCLLRSMSPWCIFLWGAHRTTPPIIPVTQEAELMASLGKLYCLKIKSKMEL